MFSRPKTADWARELGYPGVNDQNFAAFEDKIFKYFEWRDILNGVMKNEDARRIKLELLLCKICSASNPVITKRPDCIKTYDTLVDIEKGKEKSSILDSEIEKVKKQITQLQNEIKTEVEENERAENQKALNLKNSKLLHWMTKNIKNFTSDLSSTTENLEKIQKKNFTKSNRKYLLENEVQEVLMKLSKGNELSELNVILGERIYDFKQFHFELRSDSSLQLMFGFNRQIEKEASEIFRIRNLLEKKRKTLESSIEQKAENNPSISWLRFYLINKTKMIEYDYKNNYKYLLQDLLKKDANDIKLMKYLELKAKVSFFKNEMNDITEKIKFCCKVNLKNLSKFTELISDIVSQVLNKGTDRDISSFIESFKDLPQIEFKQLASNAVGSSNALIYDDLVEKADYVRMLKEFHFPDIQVPDSVEPQEEPEYEDIKRKLNTLNNILSELKKINENNAVIDKL